MAYLESKGYEFDLLISYAHNDNTLARSGKGWVSLFDEDLRTALTGISGQRNIALWRDKELTGNTYFDPEIKQKLAKSALLVVVNSNSYMTSAYCNKEIDFFYANVQKNYDPFGLTIKNNSRIFNVLLYDIPNPKWLRPLQGTSGDVLYNKDPNTPMDQKSKKYKKAIAVLAKNIWNMLEEMKMADTQKKAVFFGSFPFSLGIYKELIENEIKVKAKLVPDDQEELPRKESNHIDKIKEIIEEACTSIHLFNENAGDKFTDTEKPFSVAQAEFVLTTSKPQVIWMPRDLDTEKIEDQIQKKFIQKINESIQKEFLTVLKCPKPDIPRQIFEWLQPYVKPVIEVADNIWLIDREDDDTSNPEVIREQLTSLKQEMLNHQTSDSLDAGIKKARYYLYVITSKPFMGANRLENVVSIIASLPPDQIRNKGVYISPGARIPGGFLENINKFKEYGFAIYNAAEQPEPTLKERLRFFLKEML